jgi:hypothetical protein
MRGAIIDDMPVVESLTSATPRKTADVAAAPA